MNTVTMAAIIVTLFLGGPQPLRHRRHRDVPRSSGRSRAPSGSSLKLLVFLFVYVWFRATLPRLRYDQLMDLGWKVLIPVALGWFLLLAALRIGGDQGWNRLHVTAVGIVAPGRAGRCAAGLLSWPTEVSARNREREGAMF